MGLTLLRQDHPFAAPNAQRERLAQLPVARSFEDAIASTPHGRLRSRRVEILQINVGKKCNQTCSHCHVDAGPDREEMMDDATVDKVIELLDTHSFDLFDITGGAPELHPRFTDLVAHGTASGARVIDRCNLTILQTKKYEELHHYLAEHRVEIVASMPHYAARSTDAQRGEGVYDKSIAALKKLNAVGYGRPGGLTLTLVTNPAGAFLPAPQAQLEDDFRRQLKRRHGVEITDLRCITNMPISRFLDWLEETDNTETYMSKLVNAFNPGAIDGVMCRNTLSIGWDGVLYDCDFNQMLELELSDGQPRTIHDYDAKVLDERDVVVGPHCYGCTAGQGSSCGGATA